MENKENKSKLKYFILFIVIDIITLGLGTYIFLFGLRSLINNPLYGGIDMPFGAVLIILFFLIRFWRKEYKKINEK
ncbi:hypothetical protein Fleli_0488 [Bernardetia litoralis DSM 6794]|uniref:Uncharacterized protein n=1 Tax=Bernardetia litoralis (strain ATCC 23117 / DSM 6794 / NBRC 15988 / NCIMB 1366 / Fx l1 / Sio-4) TaxID=880071 RepID=I4AG79_BERLS|nr:hypothetical protein [Bernardetia litoralis]AFM02964.1 hypothetical protein Fleli_0488 [Bernardetia litoralis DSM 6794]